MNTALITTGPAIAPIDEVRSITNFATGEIGTLLAETLVSTGWRVHLARGRGSTFPAPARVESPALCIHAQPSPEQLTIEPFTTNASVLDFYHRHATASSIAIFHAAALCDFEVSSTSVEAAVSNSQPSRKIPSTLDTLTLHLRPAPKILPLLRELFPAAFIVGWKYEMDGDRTAAIARARAQITACRTDACVVNGAAWGEGFGIVHRDTSEIQTYPDKPTLCCALRALGVRI